MGEKSRGGRRDTGGKRATPERGPERVGHVVGRFLEAKGVAEQVRRHGALDAWPLVVGEGIAAVAHARSLSEGTLFVEVRSSAWLMELEMMKGEILKRLNAGLEDTSLERIVFVLGRTDR